MLDYWHFNKTAMDLSNIPQTVSNPAAMSSTGMPIQLNMVIGGREMQGQTVEQAKAFKLWWEPLSFTPSS